MTVNTKNKTLGLNVRNISQIIVYMTNPMEQEKYKKPWFLDHTVVLLYNNFKIELLYKEEYFDEDSLNKKITDRNIEVLVHFNGKKILDFFDLWVWDEMWKDFDGKFIVDLITLLKNEYGYYFDGYMGMGETSILSPEEIREIKLKIN